MLNLICVYVCILQSQLIQAYKMMPHTSKEELMVFISVYQMDSVTEYTGKVGSFSSTLKLPHRDWPHTRSMHQTFFSWLQTANQILSSLVLNHALLFIKKSSADFNDILTAFNNAAQLFRVKVETKHTHTHTHRAEFSRLSVVISDFVCLGKHG